MKRQRMAVPLIFLLVIFSSFDHAWGLDPPMKKPVHPTNTPESRSTSSKPFPKEQPITFPVSIPLFPTYGKDLPSWAQESDRSFWEKAQKAVPQKFRFLFDHVPHSVTLHGTWGRKKPAILLLDTGSNYSLLAAAEALQGIPTTQVLIPGTGNKVGSAMGYSQASKIVLVPNLYLSSRFILPRVMVTVVPQLPPFELPPINGNIGWPFFRSYRMVLDLNGKVNRLILYKDAPKPSGPTSQAELEKERAGNSLDRDLKSQYSLKSSSGKATRGNWKVPMEFVPDVGWTIRMLINGKAKTFLLDTGAIINLVEDPGLSKELPPQSLEQIEHMKIPTVYEQIGIGEGQRIESLGMFRVMSLQSVGFGFLQKRGIQGILGLQFFFQFRHVVFDFSAHRMLLFEK